MHNEVFTIYNDDMSKHDSQIICYEINNKTYIYDKIVQISTHCNIMPNLEDHHQNIK